MIKILHVASFNGNIGDVLSHVGLYDLLETEFGISQDYISQLDIRRFYKNATIDALKFDSDCAANFNNYDFIIIGGGGFLKQAFKNSVSGNTFDFEDQFLSKLKSRILFFSIGGINPFETVNMDAYIKTEKFIEHLYTDPRFEFLFRMDGSAYNSEFLNTLLMKNPSSVKQIFDGAYLNKKKKHSSISNSVVINIGYDQALESNLGINEITKRTSEIIVRLYQEDSSIMFEFAPHTYYDLEAFSALCKFLPEIIKRNNLKCLQTFTHSSDLKNIILSYGSARLVLTGRFHSAAFAFLFNGNFLPLYDFNRTQYQLKAIGLYKLEVTTSEDAIKAFNYGTKKLNINSQCIKLQQSNRVATINYLKKFLEL